MIKVESPMWVAVVFREVTDIFRLELDDAGDFAELLLVRDERSGAQRFESRIRVRAVLAEEDSTRLTCAPALMKKRAA